MSILLYNSIVSFWVRSFDPFLVETMLLTWFDHLSIEYDDNFWLSFTILPKFSLTKHFPLHVRCAVIIHLVLTTCGTWPLRNHFGFTFLLSWFQLFDSWWAVSAFIMLMSLIQVWCESDTLPVRSTFRYSLCISLTITRWVPVKKRDLQAECIWLPQSCASWWPSTWFAVRLNEGR